MVLVDTSIWIDHFRKTDSELSFLLHEFEVVIHPFIIGELACGNFGNRKTILSLLSNLPQIANVTFEEYLQFVDNNKLYGLGLSLVDIHLLASALLANVTLFTRDKNLCSIANKFSIQYK